MRAIDKETMFDLIIKAKRTDPETGSFAEWLAAYLVERLPTLPPPNEWVSVEERLPKPDIDVLLYFGDSAKLKMAVGGKYELDDGWYSVTDGEYYTDCDTPPIYWMPLPEEPDRHPPEGEEEP